MTEKKSLVGSLFGGTEPKAVAPSQTVPPATNMTGKLNFVDQNGNKKDGPTGTITASLPIAAPNLSADGQSYNFMSPYTGTVTLTWNDPTGSVGRFTLDFTVSGEPLVLTGTFGAAVPGTTA